MANVDIITPPQYPYEYLVMTIVRIPRRAPRAATNPTPKAPLFPLIRSLAKLSWITHRNWKPKRVRIVAINDKLYAFGPRMPIGKPEITVLTLIFVISVEYTVKIYCDVRDPDQKYIGTPEWFTFILRYRLKSLSFH
jgi:hypothetical protein